MFDIEIDPADAEHAMFTTGFGGWETFNLSAVERGEPVKWSIMSAGIEETVPLELYAPEKGARLISGIGDYGGFTHFDLNRPDPLGSHANPHFGNTNGVTGAWLKQDLIVRLVHCSAISRVQRPFHIQKMGAGTGLCVPPFRRKSLVMGISPWQQTALLGFGHPTARRLI